MESVIGEIYGLRGSHIYAQSALVDIDINIRVLVKNSYSQSLKIRGE